MNATKLYTVEGFGFDAIYTGKPTVAEVIFAVKQAKEEGLNSLQAFVKREDEAFAATLRFCQFAEQPTPEEVDRLFVRTFVAVKTIAQPVTDFGPPATSVPKNDQRVRRIHPVATA